jgi:hypothetical protein
MILDYDDELTTAGGQNMDGAASIGTKVKDAGKARDWGAGADVTPYMRITSAADSDVTTSFTVDFIGADDVALTSNPVVLSTKSILKAALTKNTVHRFPPLASGSNKRYFGVKFTPVGGNQASGAKAIVGLMSDPDSGAQDGVNFL